MALSIWGNIGNQAYALPMVKLTPFSPSTQGYVLAWSIAEQALDYAPLNVDFDSGDMVLAGNLSLMLAKAYQINAVQVVGARRTGWVPATGTTNRGTFDTATVTLPLLAQAVKTLLDDLTTHGLIGA